MDALTRRIAEWAAELHFDALPETVVHGATQRVVDTMACAVAGYTCPSATIGRRLAPATAPGPHSGRILGFGDVTSAEAAAFVNTSMIRALDFNDQYPGGHPSDALGPLLGMVDAVGADGRRLISSMVVAYELFLRFNDATDLRTRGWDQGFVMGVCTAAAVGNLLGLDAEAIGQAVAITAVANMPMRNTRAGELSLWKGAATAYATRNGVFGALLAAEGMTGPDRPFDGRHGLMDLVTGPFELQALPDAGGPFRTPEVRLKYWPVEYNAQIVVWAAQQLREQVDWREITDLDVGTYTFTWSEIASEPEKWDPQTRETADHSLPYILARTLVDGTINGDSFEPAAYLDPALRPLMAKIRVRIDDTVNGAYPETVSITIDATTRDGRHRVIEMRDPLGHDKNPMGDADIATKFQAAVAPVLAAERAAAALARAWELPRETNLSEALHLFDVA